MSEILYIFNYKSRKISLKLFLHYSQKLPRTCIHQKKTKQSLFTTRALISVSLENQLENVLVYIQRSAPLSSGKGGGKAFISPAHYEKCRCEIARCYLKSFVLSVSVSILKCTACTSACLANVICGSCS